MEPQSKDEDIYRKIRPLLLPPEEPEKKEIGFHVREERARYRAGRPGAKRGKTGAKTRKARTKMTNPADTAQRLVDAAEALRDAAGKLLFAQPVAYVYNPLAYAWVPHERYLTKWGAGRKRVLFLGMNPGPWGMAQVGVPFGEISLVRDWVGISGPVEKPPREHPKRPIEGFDCARSEVSGRRLWGYFAERFGTADAFFEDHFVANYCPLVFMEEGGKNRTPDKLPAAEQEELFALCDEHLRASADALESEWVVGVGRFAETRAAEALAGTDVRIGCVLHPSPASPAANRGWAEAAERQLLEQGIWEK